MFKEKHVVTSIDVDSSLQIRLSSLLRHMQDTATNHASKIKFGHNELSKDRHIWVIIRMQLEINRLPKLDEEFFITTHPGRAKAFMFPRHFQIYDKHNNLLLNASSTWVVLNYDTRKVVLNPFKDRKLPEEECNIDLPLPEKVLGESPVLVETRRAKYSEVDQNGHINNTRYVDYILDMHDSEFHKKKMVSSLLVNFDKEIKEGDLISLYSNNSEPEIVHGLVDNQVSFAAKITYKDRDDN